MSKKYKKFEKKQSNRKVRHCNNLIKGNFYKKVYDKAFYDFD